MCTLKKIVFTTDSLESYYENFFHYDLRDYFNVSTEDGAEVIRNINIVNRECYSSYLLKRRYVGGGAAAAAIATAISLGTYNDNHENRIKRATLEEEILFIALVSFMYSAEFQLNRHTSKADKKELIACLNELNFPWIKNIDDTLSLSHFLELTQIDKYIYREEEVRVLINAMRLVEPFMLDKLEQHLCSWNNGYFAKNYSIHKIQNNISEENDRTLHGLFRTYYKYQGLMGARFSSSMFENYFENSFFQQMKKYFNVIKQPDRCSVILSVYSRPESHWEDGNPGNTPLENFMFSGMLLYLIIVQQGIIIINKEASNDFHLASGWPFISSGPGGGPYLHPLKFIEYAGLLPRKNEMPLYLEMVKILFPFMEEKVSRRLNGKDGMKDTEVGIRFLNSTKDQVKEIKKYIRQQAEQITKLLELWSTAKTNQIYKFLEEQNIPISINY